MTTTLSTDQPLPCVCGPYLPPDGHSLVVVQGGAVTVGVLTAGLAVALCTVVVSAAFRGVHPPRRVVAGLVSSIVGASVVLIAMLMLAALDGSIVHAWWFRVLVCSYVVTVVMVAVTPVLARLARSGSAGGAAAELAEAQDVNPADRAVS